MDATHLTLTDVRELTHLKQLVSSLRLEVAEQRKEIALLREERAALLAADRPMPPMEE